MKAFVHIVIPAVAWLLTEESAARATLLCNTQMVILLQRFWRELRIWLWRKLKWLQCYVCSMVPRCSKDHPWAQTNESGSHTQHKCGGVNTGSKFQQIDITFSIFPITGKSGRLIKAMESNSLNLRDESEVDRSVGCPISRSVNFGKDFQRPAMKPKA